MIQIALCDEDRAALAHTEQLLEQYKAAHPAAELVVSAYNSSNALLKEIDARRYCELYILDVQKPGLAGIELGLRIRERNEACLILYQSDTPDCAFEAYNVAAFHYLLKPLTQAQLFPALDRALSQLQYRQNEGMAVRTAEGIAFVPYHNLNYVEQRNRVAEFHLLTGRAVTSLCLRQSMDKYLAELIKDGRFVQPHKSYLVNMDTIRRMEPDALVLAGGEVVPISKHRAAEVKRRYLDYLDCKASAASQASAAAR